MTDLFLCGPQARLPSSPELEEQRKILLQHRGLYEYLENTLKDLPRLLRQLSAFDSVLKPVLAASSALVDFLSQWLGTENLPLPVETPPNVVALPFTVLLQIALYLQHINAADRTSYRSTIESLGQHGVQGFCTGFLTAAAINFSRNEEQLAEYTAISLRLAMCIGAYIDHNSPYGEKSSSACTLSVRWSEGKFSKFELESLLARFKHVS